MFTRANEPIQRIPHFMAEGGHFVHVAARTSFGCPHFVVSWSTQAKSPAAALDVWKRQVESKGLDLAATLSGSDVFFGTRGESDQRARKLNLSLEQLERVVKASRNVEAADPRPLKTTPAHPTVPARPDRPIRPDDVTRVLVRPGDRRFTSAAWELEPYLPPDGDGLSRLRVDACGPIMSITVPELRHQTIRAIHSFIRTHEQEAIARLFAEMDLPARLAVEGATTDHATLGLQPPALHSRS